MRIRVSLVAAGLCWALAVPAALNAQEVKLPLAEFERLRQRAAPLPEEKAPAAVPFALEQAEIDLQVEAASARLSEALTVELFSDGWVSVPLPAGVPYLAADLGSAEGRIEATGALSLRGRGRHLIRLQAALPLEADAAAARPTWRLELPLPVAAIVRGHLGAGAAVQEVTVAAPTLAWPETPGTWSWVGQPGAAAVFTLAGPSRVSARELLPLRFETTSAAATLVSHTQLRVQGWIELRVVQGRLERAELELPAGFEVLSVSGPHAGWRSRAGRLELTPLAPVTTSWAIGVELGAAPREELSLPILAPIGSERARFLAQAVMRGDGLLELTDPGAGRRPTAAELEPLPPQLRASPGRWFALEERTAPPRFSVAWATGTEVLAAQIDRLLVDVALGEAGEAAYQAWAVVRNRGAQQLSISLPSGFQLLEVARDGLPVTAGRGPQGFAVPLRSGEGDQVLHLRGLLPLTLESAGGQLDLPLPAFSAPVARLEVRLVAPGRWQFELLEASRSGAAGLPPAVREHTAEAEGAPPAMLFPMPPGHRAFTAAWSALSAAPEPLALRVRRQNERGEWF